MFFPPSSYVLCMVGNIEFQIPETSTGDPPDFIRFCNQSVPALE
jgi:hypothetical protein